MVTTDLNDITKEGTALNIDFKRLSFYLNNLWIVRIMKWLRLTYIIRIEVAACNLRLKNRVELFKKFIDALVSSPPPQQELNKQMQYFKEQIEIFSELKEGVENLFMLKAHRMLGDF